MIALALLPSWTYDTLDVEGWRVHAEVALVRSDAWPPARAEMEKQLRAVVAVVPDLPLARLRKTPIWMRLDDPSTPCAAYHPAADWLAAHGTDPAMVKGVEISNARTFVLWSEKDQPWMVLHELAHSYHDAVFGFDDPRIRAVYDAAVRSGIYDAVASPKVGPGKTMRHYALTNPMEFFAETSEAYFGRNDFFPFDRWELRWFDPKAYDLMVGVWGLPKSVMELG